MPACLQHPEERPQGLLPKSKFSANLSMSALSVRLSGFPYNICDKYSSGRKNKYIGFEFGQNIGSYCAKIAIENLPNRSTDSCIIQHEVRASSFPKANEKYNLVITHNLQQQIQSVDDSTTADYNRLT